MKYIFRTLPCILLVGLIVQPALAQEKLQFPKDSVSADGQKSYHGLRINDQQAIAATDIQTLIKESQGKPVKLSGEITAACKAKGCWMNIAIDDAEAMRVTFKDYGFFVPTDAAGKTAIFEGVPSVQTTSVEELRHFAMDGGMSKEEAEKTITSPKTEISFEATGVIIKDK